MIIAVQGCSHGSLSQIYASVERYEAIHQKTVDLLLLCGDFQALRNRHDFASLAVPAKYHNLGTFHEYYSGQRRAPLLTLVIGGNHEASNYMWELYHGGWLAENIYYLGAAGCVNVGGLRIAGASGIYKDHDYNKGHFEVVPFNNSTMRSIYHIRSYDVSKLMLLPDEENTIFLSHDWPTTIPRYGNTNALLHRKPFFKQEVQTDTLGSPPLLQLLKKVQPAYWFSAHLHVKFAAIFKHGLSGADAREAARAPGHGGKIPPQQGPPVNPDEINIDSDDDDDDTAAAPNGAGLQHVANPDEIDIDSEDDEEGAKPVNGLMAPATAANPDEIDIDDEDDDVTDGDIDMRPRASGAAEQSDRPIPNESAAAAEAVKDLKVDESVDLVGQARQVDSSAASGVIGAPASIPARANGEMPAVQAESSDTPQAPSDRTGDKQTRFLALDKCGQGKEFIQFLDIPAPSDSTRQPQTPLSFTYDTRWLAITRALHPYLSLDIRQKPLPMPEHLETLVQAGMDKIENEGVLVPSLPTTEAAAAANGTNGENGTDGGSGTNGETSGLERIRGPVPVSRVQQFWPTAPPEGQPGGSPSAWYTNPQTVAFCGMLEIENKINPAPTQ